MKSITSAVRNFFKIEEHSLDKSAAIRCQQMEALATKWHEGRHDRAQCRYLTTLVRAAHGEGVRG